MRTSLRYLTPLAALAALLVIWWGGVESPTPGPAPTFSAPDSRITPHPPDVAPGPGVALAGRAPGALVRPPGGGADKPVTFGSRGPAVADELVVTFARGLAPATAEALVADAGGEITWRGARTGAAIVRFDNPDAALLGRRLLSRTRGIASVDLNLLMEGAGLGTSPEVLRDLQWHLDALALGEADSGRADGVVVAVLDTGVAYETSGPYVVAPDLAGVDFVPGYDFVNDDAFANDDQGHGTHIAATLAAQDGAASVAPGASVVPVKVLDNQNLGTEVGLAEGIRFAVDSGAQVINMSLSFAPGYFPSRLMQDAIEYASDNGVVLIAAAGNHGASNVTYPAAFRDVIAVGATAMQLAPADPQDPEGDPTYLLGKAGYSNAGYLIDVAAPGGDIGVDADGDGYPEAVLAQSLTSADPADIGYYFYAGTSQAAAQVSGLAARMLAADPTLSALDIRTALGNTADSPAQQVLTEAFGRGIVRGADALVAAGAAGDDDATRYFATMFVTLEAVGDERVARAEVEIIDDTGAPAGGVTVHGTFSGAIADNATGVTDPNGRAVFQSPGFEATGTLVAFQVDAVADPATGTFDRPSGFMRVDSLSLEMLANFGIGTSPLVDPDDDSPEQADDDTDGFGIGTSPGDGTEGTGIGTSPGEGAEPLPVASLGIGTSPIVMEFAAELQSATAVPSVQLANFGWGLATVPMTVVVERDWLLEQFPDTASSAVTAMGTGLGDSPLRFDPEQSFSEPADLDHYEEVPEGQVLLVLTFFGGGGDTGGCGIGTSPRSCSEGAGIGTSPIDTGLGFQTGRRPVLVDRYHGGDPAQVEAVDVALNSWWSFRVSELAPSTVDAAAEISGSGIGTSPVVDMPSWSSESGVSQQTFDHLGAMTDRYAPFGGADTSSPVSHYGTLLDIAQVEAGFSLLQFGASADSVLLVLDEEDSAE